MSGLKGKRQVFVNEYVQCWNATEAARAAGYKHPRQQGSRLLSFVDIQDAISSALKQNAMSADEALSRLGAMARADMGQYIDEHGIIDWKAIKRDGHLFKEIGHFKGHSGFKMHDAQAALNTILKHHGGLDDKTQNLNVDLDKLTVEQLERIAQGEDPIHVLATSGAG